MFSVKGLGLAHCIQLAITLWVGDAELALNWVFEEVVGVSGGWRLLRIFLVNDFLNFPLTWVFAQLFLQILHLIFYLFELEIEFGALFIVLSLICALPSAAAVSVSCIPLQGCWEIRPDPILRHPAQEFGAHFFAWELVVAGDVHIQLWICCISAGAVTQVIVEIQRSNNNRALRV